LSIPSILDIESPQHCLVNPGVEVSNSSVIRG